MRNTLETVKEEKRKLRQEVEELRKSVREEKIVRVVVEIINGAKEDDISQVVSRVIPAQVSVPSPKYQVPSPNSQPQVPALSPKSQVPSPKSQS